LNNARLVALMIAAEIFAMLGSSAVAATLPGLIAQWGLSSAQAGWLSGAYFLGYAVTVPVLVSLTDRIDARLVFAFGCAVGIFANAGFALFAHGFVSATLLWSLAGISMAGAYMPGLRVIIDRLHPALRLRAVPYYTASFSVGVSVSFFVAGLVAQMAGWRAAFAVAGGGCVLALACLVLATLRTPPPSAGSGSGAFDLRAVVRNVTALRYILAYGGHCWELFALRAWLVALLLFVWTKTMSGNAASALTYWSSIIALAGVPASIAGAEVALRFGRRPLILSVALGSVAIGLTLAAFGSRSFLVAAFGLLFYTVAILGDSGAITAGLVEATPPEAQGSTLALHSLVGFAGGALGPIAVGIALSFAGGLASGTGWFVALAVMAAGSGLAAFAVRSIAKA
jgi:predicted MFS family arabinose efflux permease